MRGSTERQMTMLSVTSPGDLIPANHPIRRIKPIVDTALGQMEATFGAMYAEVGRPSIPPEHLIKASLLMAFYSIRSERQFCERLRYDLLFKWFLDLNVEDDSFDHSSFCKNQKRLLKHGVAKTYFRAVLDEAEIRDLISRDHFTVDGTLLESWASLKSLKPRPNLGGQRKPKRRGGGPRGGGRNEEVDYRGEKRSNQTHYSPTDEQAKLARKGNNREAKMCLAGHVVMENRSGMVVEVEVTSPSGKAEREAAVKMLKQVRERSGKKRLTVGADKGYDTRDFVQDCRDLLVTPHVAQNQSERRRSAIDGRVATQPGYQVSQRVRKRVEEIFGWLKTVGGGRKLRYVGIQRNQHWAELTTTAFNLVRMANLVAA